MSVLLSQLGINWKLLLSQGVNFFVLLGVLTVFVWRPLAAMMQKRRETIEDGVRKAAEATDRLTEIDAMAARVHANADAKALEMIREAEGVAKKHADSIMEGVAQKASLLEQESVAALERKKVEEFEKFRKHAGLLLRGALAQAVSMRPAELDAKLIEDATKILEREKRV